jgi:hypothetical protein
MLLWNTMRSIGCEGVTKTAVVLLCAALLGALINPLLNGEGSPFAIPQSTSRCYATNAPEGTLYAEGMSRVAEWTLNGVKQEVLVDATGNLRDGSLNIQTPVSSYTSAEGTEARYIFNTDGPQTVKISTATNRRSGGTNVSCVTVPDTGD